MQKYRFDFHSQEAAVAYGSGQIPLLPAGGLAQGTMERGNWRRAAKVSSV